MNEHAILLIDKDRNIADGLELVDKAISLNSDDYKCLHSKGWVGYSN